MTAAQVDLIPVFDPSGKVKRWLEDGRGVRVWRNRAFDSSHFGSHAFTPGDNSERPGWQYEPDDDCPDVVTDPAAFTFYLRAGVVKDYSSTPAGFHAAWKYSNTLPTENTAPGGRFLHAYTVEDICYQTEERIPYPLATANSEPKDRALDVKYRACVVEWIARA